MTVRLPMVSAVLMGTFLLAACQEDTPPRPIHLEKGAYRGTPDTPLGDAQIHALQQRTATQRF